MGLLNRMEESFTSELILSRAGKEEKKEKENLGGETRNAEFETRKH